MAITQTAKQFIEQVMTTDPISVEGGMTASELAVILDENEISGAPVVDALDHVIGVVSRTDLLHRCVEGPLGSRPGTFLSSIAEGTGGTLDPDSLGTVSEFMNPEPVTAQPGESITSVARRMHEERVHRVIVVDANGHLLGVVTSLDMLAVVAS